MKSKTKNQSAGRERRHVIQTAVIVGVLAYLFSVATDLTENVWVATRPLEAWQFDELLMALAAASLAAALVAFMRLTVLADKVASLKSELAALKIGVDSRDDGPGVIVKCSLCSTYQVDVDRWTNAGDYIDQAFRGKVISGVCPACRVDVED